MPILAKALLGKRARFEKWAEKMGREALFAKHPAARGYLRDREGYRLFDRREELMEKLLREVASKEGLGASSPKKPARKAKSPSAR
jgi:deoxyhypusine synthase